MKYNLHEDLNQCFDLLEYGIKSTFERWSGHDKELIDLTIEFDSIFEDFIINYIKNQQTLSETHVADFEKFCNISKILHVEKTPLKRHTLQQNQQESNEDIEEFIVEKPEAKQMVESLETEENQTEVTEINELNESEQMKQSEDDKLNESVKLKTQIQESTDNNLNKIKQIETKD